MLENGAETYRVENTIEYLCRASDIETIDSFATPTGIFICIETSDQKYYTTLKRVRRRITNLSKIYQVNNVSRKFAEKKMEIEEALTLLEKINTESSSSKLQTIAAAGFSAGFFALLFGGSPWDGIIALGCGALIQYINTVSKFLDNPPIFLLNLLGGAISAAAAVLFAGILNIGSISGIIIGAIMPSVPGIAITNAIRDTIYGDLVSGTARAVEAILVATAIASGVGVVLNTWFLLQGGFTI